MDAGGVGTGGSLEIGFGAEGGGGTKPGHWL